jgi:hypothetical protein
MRPDAKTFQHIKAVAGDYTVGAIARARQFLALDVKTLWVPATNSQPSMHGTSVGRTETQYDMSDTGKIQIIYRPVADLIPYARNARTHSANQVSQIAGSIKEFGFTNPVLIDVPPPI